MTDAIRFGDDPKGTAEKLRWTETAIRDFVPNGVSIASIVRNRFNDAISAIPASDLAEITVKMATSDRLFRAARDLEDTAYTIDLPRFDDISIEARSFLGAMLDFSGIQRIDFAQSWSKIARAAAAQEIPSGPSQGLVSSNSNESETAAKGDAKLL